jgi:molybdopterin synthase catalytic subunit
MNPARFASHAKPCWRAGRSSKRSKKIAADAAAAIAVVIVVVIAADAAVSIAVAAIVIGVRGVMTIAATAAAVTGRDGEIERRVTSGRGGFTFYFPCLLSLVTFSKAFLMRVQVRFFAIFREMIGVKSEWKELAADTTVEQLWREYAARTPRVGTIRAAFAVNQKLVNADHVLLDGDEVGFLPPVSGGAKTLERENARKGRKPRKKNVRGKSRDSRINRDAIITRQPLDLGAFVRRVAFPGAGAIVTFSGVVRDNAHGKAVKYLEYEAYAEMAEESLRGILAEIRERWADTRAAIGHRIGRLRIGEASLVIAVAAPHRAEAYAASRYALERIKAVLPVWKKEFATDGASWVEGPVAGELTPEDAASIAKSG